MTPAKKIGKYFLNSFKHATNSSNKALNPFLIKHKAMLLLKIALSKELAFYLPGEINDEDKLTISLASLQAFLIFSISSSVQIGIG